MSEALALFWAVGTDEGRAIDWKIWRAAAPGDRIVIATLRAVVEAVVRERPRFRADGSEIMLVEADGLLAELHLYRSASAGYWDDHPDERYPGCDRDLDFDGVSARLCDRQACSPHQLDLFAHEATP